ncbi:class I mannose-6-phosphate isomerase [soil metagenome]
MELNSPIFLDAPAVHRVWGGSRFNGPELPVGEIWLVHDENVVAKGPGAGKTLGWVCEAFGEAILGSAVWSKGERHFPLLIKLIDAAEWLSIQVHPDDKQAATLEGKGVRGKTEAWYLVEAESGATVIAGTKRGVDQIQLEEAIRNGTVAESLSIHDVSAGDVIHLPAGTIHALGPGALIYEVQQSSTITYRIADWNRPASAGRALHIDQAIVCARLTPDCAPVWAPVLSSGEMTEIVSCEYFQLFQLAVGEKPVELGTAGERFHVITASEGNIDLSGDGWQTAIMPFETLVIPAALDRYEISGADSGRVLIAMPR